MRLDLVGALHPLTVITREPVLKYIITFLLGRHLHGFPSGASAAYLPFPSTTSSLNYIISDGFPQAQLLNPYIKPSASHPSGFFPSKKKYLSLHWPSSELSLRLTYASAAWEEVPWDGEPLASLRAGTEG